MIVTRLVIGLTALGDHCREALAFSTLIKDTYVKNSTGTVVPGSTYFQTLYLNIPKFTVRCNKIAGPWMQPPDVIKEQCDQLASCHGFTVLNNRSSGFLCQFNDDSDAYNTFIKLPAARLV